MTVLLERIPEAPGLTPLGGRLGRHREHDEQSRTFAVRARSLASIGSVIHKRLVPIYDQGNLGSCTGNAAAGALSTKTWGHRYAESTAVKFYRRATILDGFPGAWPPIDTGSSGLGVCKALKAYGLIASYFWAFGLEQALTALQATPLLIGIDWWSDYDASGHTGLLVSGGFVRGGHELCVDALDVDKREVSGPNSWGPIWGNQGRWKMTYPSFEAAITNGGDCVVPVP